MGCLFLVGFANLVFISMKDLRLYYEPSDDDNSNHLYFNGDDDNNIQDKDYTGASVSTLLGYETEGEEDAIIRGNDDNENTDSNADSNVDNNVDSNADSNVDNTRMNDNSSNNSSTPTLTVEDYDYDEATYKSQLSKALEPKPNLKTGAYLHVFWSGFCNQYYMFSGVLLLAKTSNHSQIIVQSIRWKDLFGTNQQIRHDVFFDVVHWNTFYPKLPRFVTYDQSTHLDLDIPNVNGVKPDIKWNIDDPYTNATNPYAIGEKRTSAIAKFYDYTKDIQKGRGQRDEAELLVMKSALRPHPAIRDIMSSFKRKHRMTNSMVLHARIEPDMQKHPMCKEHKVLNITDIVTMLYDKYPDEPPVSTVLIILNRAILEKEVANPKNDNEMAIYNLKTLNEIISNGLWGGRVKVVEAGSELAKNSKYPLYSKYSSLVGAIINFYLSLEAEIFVGTIVSSYSTSVISYRFFREKKENYFYLPKGLDLVTPPGTKEPPRFAC